MVLSIASNQNLGFRNLVSWYENHIRANLD